MKNILLKTKIPNLGFSFRRHLSVKLSKKAIFSSSSEARLSKLTDDFKEVELAGNAEYPFPEPLSAKNQLHDVKKL